MGIIYVDNTDIIHIRADVYEGKEATFYELQEAIVMLGACVAIDAAREEVG